MGAWAVNLEASVPGWKRFPAAQRWLDSHREAPITPAPTPVSAETRAEVERFFDERMRQMNIDPSLRESYFKDFLRWREQGERTQR